MEKACSIHIIAIVIVNIAETTGMSAGENDHPSFEHLNEMAGLITLCEANLHSFTGNFVIQSHSVNCRSGFFVLAAVVTLNSVIENCESIILH